MPGQDLAERVAYLEGKVEEHSKAWDEVREELRSIHSRIDALSARIDSLADSFNDRIDALTKSFNERIDRTNARIDELDRKFSRYFLWIFGIQITILLSIIATLLRLTSP